MNCSPPGSAVHEIFQAKDTGVGCHFLLQRIFPTQGLNLGLRHWRQMLYRLSYKGSLKTEELRCLNHSHVAERYVPWVYLHLFHCLALREVPPPLISMGYNMRYNMRDHLVQWFLKLSTHWNPWKTSKNTVCLPRPRVGIYWFGCGIGFAIFKRFLSHSNVQTNLGTVSLDSLDLIFFTSRVDVWVKDLRVWSNNQSASWWRFLGISVFSALCEKPKRVLW